MSDVSKGLLAALFALQADAPHIPLDSTNPHFKSKFASLPDVLKIVRPKLAEHGLLWMTMPAQDEQGRPVLKYKLTHVASGESEQGEMPLMPVKDDPQSLGSAITYARRYSLLTVLGLVGDDDDDGNAGSGRQQGGTQLPVWATPLGDTEAAKAAKVAALDALELAVGDRDVARQYLGALANATGGLPVAVAGWLSQLPQWRAAAAKPDEPAPGSSEGRVLEVIRQELDATDITDDEPYGTAA